jgi:DNA mismatch repair protein MutL
MPLLAPLRQAGEAQALIRKLPEDLIRHIAAGEIVERPASVLKELVENSLDAGARRIVVSWEDAGKKSIRVTDDGAGMSPEDARLALERHATSKISSLDDLSAIGTYGFRGEALPSIAAVSRFQLVTRPQGASEAWSIEVEGGKIVREGPAGAPPGTSVSVENLFFNTPARLKFLKSDATERGLLSRVVEDAIFAARPVDFQVFSEGRETINLKASPEGTSPETALRERIARTWGRDKAASVEAVRAEGRYMTVWGWISDVHSHQSSAKLQRFYVNGRPVIHRRLIHALYDAYKGRLFTGRHPVAALFLEINPSLVDVNVHPSKREVRFSSEGEVYDFLSRALQSALSGGARMPEAMEERGGTVGRSSGLPPLPFSGPTLAETRAAYLVQAPAGPSPIPSQTVLAGSETEGDFTSLETFREAVFEPLCQFDDTYILVRSAGQLFIFDQHAAAERALFEKLQDGAEGKLPLRQPLLLPWVWEVSPEVAAMARDRLEDLTRMGYELEAFGEKAFRVRGVPAVLGDSGRVKEILEGLVDDLISEKIPKQWDAILVRAACLGSARAGDPLELAQMKGILADLQTCRSPWSCPHGRPTFLRVEPGELARRFRRT